MGKLTCVFRKFQTPECFNNDNIYKNFNKRFLLIPALMFQIEVDFLFPPVSVSLLVSGLPQHLVPEAEDAGYSEGEEESAKTGVEEAETR